MPPSGEWSPSSGRTSAVELNPWEWSTGRRSGRSHLGDEPLGRAVDLGHRVDHRPVVAGARPVGVSVGDWWLVNVRPTDSVPSAPRLMPVITTSESWVVARAEAKRGSESPWVMACSFGVSWSQAVWYCSESMALKYVTSDPCTAAAFASVTPGATVTEAAASGAVVGGLYVGSLAMAVAERWSYRVRLRARWWARSNRWAAMHASETGGDGGAGTAEDDQEADDRQNMPQRAAPGCCWSRGSRAAIGTCRVWSSLRFCRVRSREGLQNGQIVTPRSISFAHVWQKFTGARLVR